MTFSIVGRATDPATGQPCWGVAVAPKFLAVGNAVPAAVAGVGALATQADANVAWKGIGLSLLDEGATAEVALQRMLEEDEHRADRQIGIVDADGNAATHTGGDCFDWAGGIAEPDVAVQGNILAGPEVVEQMKQAWDAHADSTLAHRLLAALRAGDDAGGDRRGKQSAALLVVMEEAGYAGLDDVAVDLRVDDHPEPVTELGRLLELNDFYLTAPTDAEKVEVTPALAEELDRHARTLGHEHLREWVGSENYEMRVAPGLKPAWIDPTVLQILRDKAAAQAPGREAP
jgi:uncharacterized Ntn-hydrolase superfamily protein